MPGTQRIVELAAVDEAQVKEAVAELRKLDPSFTLQSVAGDHPSDDPTYKAQSARIFEGLRRAGLPEE